MEGQTDRQNYDSQDRASVAASGGKNLASKGNYRYVLGSLTLPGHTGGT